MASSVAIVQPSSACGLASNTFTLAQGSTLVVAPTAKKSGVAASVRIEGRNINGFFGRSLKRSPIASKTLFCRKSRAVRAAVGVKDIGEADFENEVLKSDVPVLVDFWATWCGPCKLIAPLMTWIAQEYQGKLKVVKVETDPNPSLVEKYKVYGLPTLIVFHKGAPVEGSHSEGAITKDKLKKFVEKSLPELAAK